MTLEQGLVALLRADATVGPLVANGTSPQTWRIYPEFMPAGVTYPAMRYARISSEPLMSLSGPIGQATVRLQLDCWAVTHDACRTLADAVRDALDGVTGNLGGVRVGHAYLENFAHMSEIEGDREDHRITMDLVVTLTD